MATFICGICTETILDPATGDCCHHFCLVCYTTWLAKKPSCPNCRRLVVSPVVDVEFAALCGAIVTTKKPSTQEDQKERQTRSISINGPAGITLENTPNRVGVRVKGVTNYKGASLAGIRVGDVVIRVNDVVCDDHLSAVSCIDRRCSIGDCTLDLLFFSGHLERSSAFRMQRLQRSPLATQ